MMLRGVHAAVADDVYVTVAVAAVYGALHYTVAVAE